MKRVIICCIIFLSISILSKGQVQKKDSTDSTNKMYSHIVRFSEMDQRKIYHWGNGQTATATGRDAGEHLPDYVKLIGDDSAIVVKSPKGEPFL